MSLQNLHKKLRRDAETIWTAAISAVRPQSLVKRRLSVDLVSSEVYYDEKSLEPPVYLNRVGRIVIVGGGKVGSHLATLLLAGQHQVVMIEQRAEVVKRLQHELPRARLQLGSGTDPLLLEAVGIQQTDVVAAVTGQDETNLVIATLARFAFNAPRVIARVNNPKNAWIFTPQMGVDVALKPIPKWDFYEAVASADHVLTIQTADQQPWANLLLSVGCRTFR